MEQTYSKKSYRAVKRTVKKATEMTSMKNIVMWLNLVSKFNKYLIQQAVTFKSHIPVEQVSIQLS